MQLTGPISTGQLSSIGGTALQLTTTPNPLNNGIYISAPAANVDTVYVGLIGVTTGTGFPILKGTTSPLIPVKDPTTLYVISGGSGDSVAWLGS